MRPHRIVVFLVAANYPCCMRMVLIAALSFVSATLCAQGRQLSPALQPYVSCRSVAGATLVQTTPLVAAPSKRTVQTLQGDKQIDITDGARLNYTLNGFDYAYLRVEQLTAETYLQGKTDLLSNFKRLISGDELAFPADMLAAKYQGFLIFGEDHKQMLGETLGIYLLIDDRTRVAVTIYFQNKDLDHHLFADMGGYAKLRDGFLTAYPGCVRTSLSR